MENLILQHKEIPVNIESFSSSQQTTETKEVYQRCRHAFFIELLYSAMSHDLNFLPI